jgi:hypothetical protein
MTCTAETTYPTGNVIIAADIVGERLSSVYNAEGKIFDGHKFKDDSRGVNSCDTMADNRGHGLISIANRTARPMIR